MKKKIASRIKTGLIVFFLLLQYKFIVMVMLKKKVLHSLVIVIVHIICMLEMTYLIGMSVFLVFKTLLKTFSIVQFSQVSYFVFTNICYLDF